MNEFSKAVDELRYVLNVPFVRKTCDKRSVKRQSQDPDGVKPPTSYFETASTSKKYATAWSSDL